MFPRRNSSALALALAVGLGGCAFIGVGGGDEEEEEPERLPVTVLIQNRNWSDITIYAIRGGTRARLGTVTSMNSATFVIPADIAGSSDNIQLLADPVGSFETFLSEPIVVRPGEQLEWLLANNLKHSAISVW